MSDCRQFFTSISLRKKKKKLQTKIKEYLIYTTHPERKLTGNAFLLEFPLINTQLIFFFYLSKSSSDILCCNLLLSILILFLTFAFVAIFHRIVNIKINPMLTTVLMIKQTENKGVIVGWGNGAKQCIIYCPKIRLAAKNSKILFFATNLTAAAVADILWSIFIYFYVWLFYMQFIFFNLFCFLYLYLTEICFVLSYFTF